ncbi:MAG: DegT/DnrJ/EryC1/StrS family aminotransferase [Deltaproteobacteria bacterium]|nr:DegT/DnrJ/EryC1/StrS family aminotransferase [Deltaproteobacteria bacterium]
MNYTIPLFDLNYDREEEQAVLDVLRSKWVSLGPRTEAFEQEFAARLGVQKAVALSNCTVALHLALRVLGIGPGDEVLCPSLTFVATANAIQYVGAVPVFADIVGYEDLTLDPEDIVERIGEKTRAIMVMHYGGFPCRMDRIMEIAARYHLQVIEDASHAPTAEYGGQKLGTIGQGGCFSFFSNKNIGVGEGGMLVTNDPSLADQARLLRSHGMTSLSYDRARGHSTAYDVVALGYNYRFDDLRAALGLVQLKKLPADVARRDELRRHYLERLSPLPEIIVPFQQQRGRSTHYIFPILLKDSNPDRREKVRAFLMERGIQTSVHYPAVHRFSIYEKFRTSLPRTEYAADNEITLPLYGSLSHSQVDLICNTLKDALS